MTETADMERLRRWRLALGGDEESAAACGLTSRDRGIDKALGALYDSSSRRGGLGGSAPRVSRWLGDIREYFPTPVVQMVQKDAFERLGLHQMLLEPEFLATMEANVHLVADLLSLGTVIPEKTKETAREVVQKVVDELMKKLAHRTTETLRGALNKAKRTNRPRFSDIDWPRTIAANLQHYQEDFQTVVPERLIGFERQARTQADLDQVILCVDQSGSMATSVVYSSIFAAVMASIPALQTKLICFDTQIIDMTEQLEDPVEVLFGVQLGGGTDINQAIAYCAERIEQPSKTNMILITDLYEGGDEKEMLARSAKLIDSGVNLITLLALSDDGKPSYDSSMAQEMAARGSPVFACTPDQFPDLMAVALQRGDVQEWASDQDINMVRPG